jgi:transcriptional regulator with XRE-family HTH domain
VAFSNSLALDIGRAVAEERRRRGWTLRQLAERSRISVPTIGGVEAGRPASVDVYGRLAVVVGIDIKVTTSPARRTARDRTDIVHSAMGELEANLLARHDHELAIDHPY